MLSQIYDYVTKYASTLVVSKAIAISGLAFQSLKMHWAESFERKIAPNTSKKVTFLTHCGFVVSLIEVPIISKLGWSAEVWKSEVFRAGWHHMPCQSERRQQAVYKRLEVSSAWTQATRKRGKVGQQCVPASITYFRKNHFLTIGLTLKQDWLCWLRPLKPRPLRLPKVRKRRWLSVSFLPFLPRVTLSGWVHTCAQGIHQAHQEIN